MLGAAAVSDVSPRAGAVEVDVLVALLGPGALELVLQLVDLAAQRAQLAVHELDLAQISSSPWFAS